MKSSCRCTIDSLYSGVKQRFVFSVDRDSNRDECTTRTDGHAPCNPSGVADPMARDPTMALHVSDLYAHSVSPRRYGPWVILSSPTGPLTVMVPVRVVLSPLSSVRPGVALKTMVLGLPLTQDPTMEPP